MSRRTVSGLCGAAVFAALIGVGCSDAVSSGPQVVRQDQLALGLAKAMGRADVRLAVRDAMRASRVTEHKLILQDFIATEAGSRLIEEVASQLGWSQRTVRDLIDGLPRVQFYVPVRAHRRSWTGGSNIAVALNLTENGGHLNAVDPLGTAVLYDMTGRPGQVDERPALFVIEAAESMNQRVNAQPATAGNVIQDAVDGEISGEVEYTDVLGRVRRIQLADLVKKRTHVAFNCEEDPFAITCGGGGNEGGGGGDGPFPDPTYIKPFITNGVCDNGNCFEGNEFEFFVDIVNANGVVRTSNFVRVEGIGAWDTRDIFLIQNHLGAGEWMNVDIWERDGWFQTDDSFDPNPNVYPNQNARTNSSALFHAGNVLCLHYNEFTGQCDTFTSELFLRFWW